MQVLAEDSTMNIGVDLGALDLDDLISDLETVTEAVLDAVAERALELNDEEIQTGTYDTPEGPGWKRSGAWKNGQEIESEPGERRIVTTGTATAYEGRIAMLNSSRRNPAKAKAAERLESEVESIVERVLDERLNR